MKKSLSLVLALMFAVSAGAVTSPPSGPTVPNQPKDTSVFKDTDGTCYSREAKTFGKVIPCPK